MANNILFFTVIRQSFVEARPNNLNLTEKVIIMGFGKVIRMTEDKARQVYNEKLSERENKVLKLKEKYSKSKGLAFGNGKLNEMFDKDSRKASNLLLFLENSEIQARRNPTIAQNVLQEQAIKNMSASQMTEAMQTGGSMALMLPTDIVKISRIGYSNSIAHEVFDVWGMSSMKDSLYKLETTYGSTARGATADTVTYENYGEGRYPSTFEQETLTSADGITWTGTLAEAPAIPFKCSVFLDDGQVAVDNGAGVFVGEGLDPNTPSTVNYTTGAVSLVFASAVSGGTSASVIVQYAYDFEDPNLFSRTGSVLLNLVEYNFSAILYPLEVEWTRFSEDLMNSKLGLSAKDMLIAGAGDEFRKAFDERCIAKGIKASAWHAPVTFDTDFATAGADSSYAHAQSITSAIINGENLAYDAIGRLADTTNIVCDSASYAYLTKHNKFVSVTPSSKVGIFKVGELDGRGVYMAPKSVINPAQNTGKMFLFGKSTEAQNVDAPVSVGTYGTGITTNPVELKNFNSQMGLGVYADSKINNKHFATVVTLENLTANS